MGVGGVARAGAARLRPRAGGGRGRARRPASARGLAGRPPPRRPPAGGRRAVWRRRSWGALAGAVLGAGFAVILPWLVRGRLAALDVIGATAWAAGLAAAGGALGTALGTAIARPDPRGAIAGAVVGGAFAVAARMARGEVTPARLR